MGKEWSVKEAVLDGGVSKPSSRVFAVLKGCLDAGMKIPHSDKVLPVQERLDGKHINDKIITDVNKIKEKILKDGKNKSKKSAKPKKQTKQKKPAKSKKPAKK